MINGKPHGRFKSTRGIRQGDPISLFLFVLPLDYLSRLLNTLEERGSIKGVTFNALCSLIHLLFADDILIFVEDNDRFMENFKMAIKIFEMVSGLKMNTTKSSISPINVDQVRTTVVSDFWGFNSHNFPIDFLGTPLGGKMQ